MRLAGAEHGVLGEASCRARRAWPLRSSGTQHRPSAPARRGTEPADRLAVDAGSMSGVIDGRSPDERQHQLVLAVAGDAGDAEDLAGADLEADALEVDAEAARSVGRSRSSTIEAARRRAAPARPADELAASAPIISWAMLSRGLGLGIAVADDLAAAQDRGAVAERFDLVQLVADVEDRAALGRELAQRLEQLSTSCGVSTEVGSSMISSLRVLQQAADDLDRAGARRPRACGPRARGRAAGRRRWMTSRTRARQRRMSVTPSTPRATFSSTVIASNSEKCWNTMPMPSARAAWGSATLDRLGRPRGSRPRRRAARRR